ICTILLFEVVLVKKLLIKSKFYHVRSETLLDKRLAQLIVNEIMENLYFNINIMNKEGVIIASGNPMRINQIHYGALEVINHKKVITIYRETNNELPGINMPLSSQSEI